MPAVPTQVACGTQTSEALTEFCSYEVFLFLKGQTKLKAVLHLRASNLQVGGIVFECPRSLRPIKAIGKGAFGVVWSACKAEEHSHALWAWTDFVVATAASQRMSTLANNMP